MHHGGRRGAEDGERSPTFSRGVPRAWVVRVFQLPTRFLVGHSAELRHEHSTALRHETPVCLRSEYPALRRRVGRKDGWRCARARRVAANPLRDEACLRQA